MLSVLFIAVCIIAVFGDRRNFIPRDPLGLINEDRVWVHLNPKCFVTEEAVRTFKDHLLSNYDCIDFNEERKIIYKHQVTANYSVWSLWLEKTADLQCLDTVIDLPSNVLSSCIDSVYFEPMQTMQQQDGCNDQSTDEGIDLWSLDIIDGIFNDIFIHPTFSSAVSDNVEAIILDGGVIAEHLEFSGLSTNDLMTGTPSPSTSYEHGTHVAGTVVGHTVGGSKGTKLNYYAVCQAGNGCAWSTIEAGYNAAIDYMIGLRNTGKRFVINYSVGGGRNSVTDVQYNSWGRSINEYGGIWVTSAGNSDMNACEASPAFTTEAITVGAYDVDLNRAWFSNYATSNSDCVDAWGPGVLVWSADSNDLGAYSPMSGTSMSSPNVAALIVNMLKDDSSLTLAQIKEKLLNDARYVSAGNYLPMNQVFYQCSSSA